MEIEVAMAKTGVLDDDSMANHSLAPYESLPLESIGVVLETRPKKGFTIGFLTLTPTIGQSKKPCHRINGSTFWISVMSSTKPSNLPNRVSWMFKTVDLGCASHFVSNKHMHK